MWIRLQEWLLLYPKLLLYNKPSPCVITLSEFKISLKGEEIERRHAHKLTLSTHVHILIKYSDCVCLAHQSRTSANPLRLHPPPPPKKKKETVREMEKCPELKRCEKGICIQKGWSVSTRAAYSWSPAITDRCTRTLNHQPAAPLLC